MKICKVISPILDNMTSMKDGIREKLKTLADLGYEAVELALRNPDEINIGEIKEFTRSYDIEIAGIAIGRAYLEEGLSFSSSRKEVRRKAIARMKDMIRLISEFNSPTLLFGLMQGRLDEKVRLSQARRWIVEYLRESARFAQRYSVEISIEPINRYELNYHNTVEEVKELIDEIAEKNISLLLDSFHMNIEEVSIHQSIISSKGYVGYVHLADSNKLAPGCGHLDFSEIIDTLKEIKYDKYLSVEILPQPDPDTAAQRAITYLRKFIQPE